MQMQRMQLSAHACKMRDLLDPACTQVVLNKRQLYNKNAPVYSGEERYFDKRIIDHLLKGIFEEYKR
jgi:hypothetical protein